MDLEQKSYLCSKSDTDVQQFLKNIDPTKEVIAYTDGACSGNPGPGGWGVYMIQEETMKKDSNPPTIEYGGGSKSTTNNRMELIAAIEAINVFPNEQKIKLFSDSQYVVKGITSWVTKWKKNKWKKNQKEAVANADLWSKLDQLNESHCVEWNWVKGHDVSYGNNRADFLATSHVPRENMPPPLDVQRSETTKMLTLSEILGNIVNGRNESENIEKLKKYDEKYNLQAILQGFIQTI